MVTFTADLGQGEELAPAREKALRAGIKPENIFIEDLREEFVRDFVFPMFRANTVYEGQYLLGTSIARPLIAKKQIEIARKVGADAVCHGATGKGNDQVRFELTYYALEPDIKVIAPWREWNFNGREELLTFAERHQITIAKDKEARRRSRSTPTFALVLRGQSAGGSGQGGARVSSISAPSRRGRAGQGDRHPIGFARATRSASTARGCRRRPCSPSSTSSGMTTASAASIWWRTASSA